MMKRFFDVLLATFGLLLVLPVLTLLMFLVWLQDRRPPLYIPNRVGLRGKYFRMVKLRSMTYHADASGVESTSATDVRITKLGRTIRKLKLDELSQLINVIIGDMSLVGPRPNTISEVNKYSNFEMGLLEVRPGITDLSSIVFSDEGMILSQHINPDKAYQRFIRPWKSKFGVWYVKNQSFSLDILIVTLTILSLFDRRRALKILGKVLKSSNAPDDLIKVCQRKNSIEENIGE